MNPNELFWLKRHLNSTVFFCNEYIHGASHAIPTPLIVSVMNTLMVPLMPSINH